MRQNDPVRVGQLLAELSSPELDQQLIEIDRKLADARAERDTATQQFNLALSQRAAAHTRIRHQSLRASQLQQDLGDVASSSAPPRIRQLQSQQREKISQIDGLQAQLAIVNNQIDRYQGLVQAGAMSLSKLDELKREQAALSSQINTLQAQTQTLTEQMAATAKEMRDELNQTRQPEVEEAQSALQSVDQEVARARSLIQKWEQQIPLLQNQRQQVGQRQQGLKLRTRVNGVVVTPDLDVLEHQKLPDGKEVLTVAEQTQSSAVIEFPQSDASRSQVGMPVTFRLQDGDLQGFSATVVEIPPVVAPENPQQPPQKAMVKVRMKFEDISQPFTLGTKGYAHVQIGQVWLYQKVQREILKLVPVGRFW